jgi:hypothetical protein
MDTINNNVIEYTEISKKNDVIIENLNLLDNNINKIKKKITNISKIYKNLESNTILTINNNNFILFQTKILKNEFFYYNNLYKMILDKYTNEIYELSHYVIQILHSLNNLEIPDKNGKSNIYNKIIRVNKTNNVNYGKLNEIINGTINNLKIIDEFINLFNNYINKVSKKNDKDNIHNGNYEISIKNKKNNILMEYNKYYSKFKITIDYFQKCSETVIHQIDNSNLLKFFLTEKSI